MEPRSPVALNGAILKTAFATLLNDYEDENYRYACDQPFTEYPSNLSFNHALVLPAPDFIQGISLTAFKPYPVKDLLDGSAVPTEGPDAITLAHLVGEFKKPGKNLMQAQCEAAYDAAHLVYARNMALKSIGKSDPPGTAHVGSFVSDGTYLKTFVHYALTDALGKTSYHQYLISSTDIQASDENFRLGIQQLRNLQDMAREKSYSLKKELLEHYELSQTQKNQ